MKETLLISMYVKKSEEMDLTTLITTETMVIIIQEMDAVYYACLKLDTNVLVEQTQTLTHALKFAEMGSISAGTNVMTVT